MQSRPAVPVSPPCPSNHLQAQVTAGGWRAALHLTGDAGPRTPLISAKPAPPNACGGGLGRGCGGHCACAAPRPAPPLAGSAEGLPPAPRPPPPHLGSSLVGAEAGPEAPGGPPTRAVHGVPGVSGRLPASRLVTGQRAPGPAP